jgi:hypothetical protein
MKSGYSILICLLVAFALVAGAAAQDVSNPLIPHAFNGSVADNHGNPAPAGTEIAAYINSDERGSITTTEAGSYGCSNFKVNEPMLVVQGEKNGETITFFVNGIRANEQATFVSSGDTRLSLTTKEAIPASPPDSIEILPVNAIAGQEVSLSFPDAGLWIGLVTGIDVTGEVSVAGYPHDENPVGTGIAGLSGVKYIAISSTIPNDAISKATLRLYYTDEELAALGISEASLTFDWWDGSAWQDITTARNTDANYVEGVVDHFSIFGLFGAPGGVAPTPTQTGGGGGGGGGTGGGTGGSGGATFDSSTPATNTTNVTTTTTATPTVPTEEPTTLAPETTATTVSTGDETPSPEGEVPMLAIIGVVILAVAAVGGIFYLRRR